MGFIELLIQSSLIFIIARVYCISEDTENISSETSDYCSQDKVAPVHYNVKLTPYTEEDKFRFAGECNVTIQICYPTTSISLHLGEILINKRVTALINNNGTMYKPIYYTGHITRYITDLIFGNELSPGLYILYVRYSSKASVSRAIGTLYRHEGYILWLALSPFPSVAVRLNAMCFDDPVLRSTYKISVKHHQRYKALSNMPIREEYTDSDGMIWSHFDTSPPMSACTAIVVVLNFHRVPNAEETINMWCRYNCTHHVKFALIVAEKVMQYMNVQYTNISQLVSKTDLIAIPDLYSLEGFSNWGLLFYNENNITYDDDNPNATRKRKMAGLIAHEVIHLWFGNLVAINSWSDSWLMEGISSFLSEYILNKIVAHWRTIDFLVVESLHASLRTDTGSIIESLISGMNESDMDSISVFYNKENINTDTLMPRVQFIVAASVIRMLQHLITEDVFQKGVNIFLSSYQFKSASTDDLWTAMQAALDQSNVPNKYFKIKQVMDPWVNQVHYPLVTVTRNYETGEVIVSQQHYRSSQESEETESTDDAKWWIPITYTTQTNPDFTNTALNFRWISSEDENISFVINSSDWIIVNVQQTGYYRVNYDTTNWQKIADYLKTDEYSKIHVLNRAQLIDDAFNLVMESKLDSPIFLNLSNYLSRETDYIPWYPMFYILSKMSDVFLLPEGETLKSQLTGIFNKLMENVGFQENPNEDEFMTMKRQMGRYWACTLDNPTCQRMATINLEKLLGNQNNPTLISTVWAYCAGLKAANMTIWNKVMNLYAVTQKKELLKVLACSRNPDIIINYLNIASSNNSIIQEEEHIFVFSYIVNMHARNNVVVGYMLKNLERIKPKLITTNDALKNITSSIISKEQLKTVYAFVQKNIEGENSLAIQKELLGRYIEFVPKVDIYSEQFIRSHRESLANRKCQSYI